MLCQNCQQRPATIHITKIINGEKNELHLCDKCSSLNDMFHTSFNFQNFITNLIDFGEKQHNFDYTYDTKYRCNKCGMDYNTFKKYNKFGCEECYETLRPIIDPIIKKIHGKNHHTGKVIKELGKDINLKKQLTNLNTNLKEAISKEEYEQAAVYRDEIKKIKEQLFNEQ